MNMRVRQLALECVRGALQKDYAEEARRCLEFVREEIRYVRDIDNVETLHTCDAILDLAQGDCDDKAILLAAMLSSLGHPVRFVVLGYGSGQWVHVWVQDLIYGKWVDLEPTEPIAYGNRVPDKPGSRYLYEAL